MSGYIGTQPIPQATQTRDVFTATSGQTSFATSGYTPNFLDVWLNGVKLVNGDDFTATNGSDVVLTTGAAAGDTVEVLAFSTFNPADTATAAQGALADTAVQPNDNVTLGAVTATSFSGDGSGLTNLPAPTTADVLSATAGASVGAVGTYAFMLDSGAGVRVEGTLRQGSVLKYSNTYTNGTTESGGRNSSPAGTWMLMGAIGYYQVNLSYNSASQLRISNSLWLRIS